MCGIVGFLGGRGNRKAHYQQTVQKMADAIAYRGPDDAGYWNDEHRRIAFGHRRLAILDLSAAGHQPMLSGSGRYVIVFNGEIYNHRDLRKDLQDTQHAPVWRGTSDTETLMAGFDAWGIQATIERAIGMFAFAVWDRQERQLTLGRDRIGEKPLYYGWQGQGEDATFLFGSELKALRAHPAFENNVDRGALSLQIRHGCVPAPYSIFEGVFKLEPGMLLCVSLERREPRIWAYWSGVQTAISGVERGFSGSAEDAVDELEQLLKDAIGQQMLADVPLGAFLSGGVDSSTIVALMQTQSSRPVKTFTIGFHESDFDEAKLARAVSAHLGTDHTELYVTPQQALDVIPRLPVLYDEPFADSSQIPTFLVSQLARQHVTVSLSGDAGDELFCGYQRYRTAPGMWDRMTALPVPLRKLVASGIAGISPKHWNSVAGFVEPMLPSLRGVKMGDKLHKGAALLSCTSRDEVYLHLMSQWNDPAALVIGGYRLPTRMDGNVPSFAGLDEVQRMMALDMISYLPDDILTKVDRAAMGVSLETRVPFLDHRVVEFAWRLPQSMKVRNGQTKWALRQVLYRHVPRELIERPKQGFAVPIGHWLRGELREWAEALLDTSRLRREGFFEPAVVRSKWEQHLSGERNWHRQLWNVLMFQLWLEHQQESSMPLFTLPVAEMAGGSLEPGWPIGQ
ncbi:asparagine synthase (glutamine-hydrolyzing) [Paraburkholderia sp. DGU8]|uniref:asparagine synthase (glutamine-hydrolyzing) n=1 Tax=Paraburkholderia sp. DGU8 TaxID=3161997 RepID=UPI00346501EA